MQPIIEFYGRLLTDYAADTENYNVSVGKLMTDYAADTENYNVSVGKLLTGLCSR